MDSPDHTFSRRRLLQTAISLLPAGRVLRGQQDTPSFSAGVKVVNVLATVRDTHGQIVKTLNKDDFLLEEEGRAQTIRYFARETDLPLTLGLLVDTSMSQRRVLGEERNASSHFVDQVLREGKDEAFLIHFDFDVELLQDLTSSRAKLKSTLAQLETPERPQLNRRDSPAPHSRRRGGT
ncbi:MAG: VWA domain-containing protein, partial [Acidobacteria bacterium]